MFQYMIIENNLDLVQQYDKIGVDRIFVDLEINGKYQRQGHLDTVISNHHIDDVKKIKPLLSHAQLLVRINPVYSGTQDEVEQCISSGADVLMLPMFKTADEVRFFIKKINKRAKVCLLLETAQALCRIDDILKVEGIDEIHIGLNDLHLALGLDFMFELLSGGVVEYLVNKIKRAGIAFGFGGVATCDGGLVNGALVLSEHVRLGSSMVIMSRAFKNLASQDMAQFKKEFYALKSMHQTLSSANPEVLLENQESLKKTVCIVLAERKKEQSCIQY